MYQARPNSFRVVQLNAENLFLYLDDVSPRDWRKLNEKEWQKLSSATVANKSLAKTWWLADSLKVLDADVICLNEVGGLESLSNFAQIFLEDRYVPFLIEGNSDRGIDVGYLVRRQFPFSVEIRTHKDRPIQFLYPHEQNKTPARSSHYFSRDCAELRILDGDKKTRAIFLLVHLKSKLDPDGIDPQGRKRREAELKTLVQIYNEVRAEFSPPVPVLVAGDFNGCASRQRPNEEFAALLTTDLESVIDILGLPLDEHPTQLQFQRNGGCYGLQIDFIFVSPELKQNLSSEGTGVFRYLSDLNIPLPLPTTLEQRLLMPSDHYPIVATFKNLF